MIYRCSKCKRYYDRDYGDHKKWTKSYCEKTGQDARLVLLKDQNADVKVEIEPWQKKGNSQYAFNYISSNTQCD